MSHGVSNAPSLLLVASEFPPGPGGIGTHAHHVAEGLAGAGWSVTVVAPQDYTDPASAARFADGRPYRMVRLPRTGPKPIELLCWQRILAGVLRRVRPVIAVLSGMGAALPAGIECRRRRVPYVVVGHGMEFTGVAGWRRRMFRRSCDRARLLIAVSRYTAGLAARAGIAPTRVEVIPNGADGRFFHTVGIPGDWREIRGLGKGPLLLTTGRLCERKGQDLVLRALARLAGRHPDLEYAAVGLPADVVRLRALARELGVDARFHTPGPVAREELPFWYSAADIFALVSRPSADGDVEGYGIVAIEAALCGTPAVVSDHGGLPEAVEDGATGWVVPEGDVARLADCVAGLLEDRARIAEAGAAALERARADCTWDLRVARYDEVLRAAAGVARA